MARKPDRSDIREDVLRILRNNGHRSFRPKELAKKLNYRDNKTYRLYREVLAEMQQDGLVAKARRGQVMLPRSPAKVQGRLRVNPQGFGFIEVEGRDEDLYVREPNMGNALDGDIVLAGLSAPARGDRRREAEVLEVIERKRTTAVGTFYEKGSFAFVETDDKRITHDVYVPKKSFNGATNGMKVVVSIDHFDSRRTSPQGRILEVIGPADDPSVQVLALAMSFDVRSGFPKEVIEAAERIPLELPKEEVKRRLDLRDLPVFTIDPVDAKDFDDAIHIKKLEDELLEVGVHIADVSHYVEAGSLIDQEAYERATSVYLVDRVIPMLPQKLSNGACSLRPDEDKFAFSVIIRITTQGVVKGYDIRETVIRSKQRFTYEEAQTIIDGGNSEHPLAGDVVLAARLARTLTRRRMRKGAVDFDIPEVRVELDDEGKPVNIYRVERREANRTIEELMLLANRVVARHIARRSDPKTFVYRVHDRPDAEKILKLAEYVRAFGYRLELSGGNVDSGALNDLLEQVKGSPVQPVIEQAALRSMAKAIYSMKNIGHYGLAFRYYSHFTSPIRRYPDLMAHRLLKRYANGGSSVDEEQYEAYCEHCSGRERSAVEAERESVKLKQVEFIREHLGASFDGVISGVTKFGIFVELNDLLVEGMVHVRDMDDDFYEYDERTYRLVGRHSGRQFRLGDPVRVTVVGANVENREVDFLFAD